MQGIRFLVSLHAESQHVQLRWNVFFTNTRRHFGFVSHLTVKMVVSFCVIQTTDTNRIVGFTSSTINIVGSYLLTIIY